jgi:hypothetical protein
MSESWDEDDFHRDDEDGYNDEYGIENKILKVKIFLINNY